MSTSQVQEPFGFISEYTFGFKQSEYVAKITKNAQPEHGFTVALYTAPQAQQPSRAVKLSDAAIREAADNTDEGQEPAEYALGFARAIEAAVLTKLGVKV